ncbi:MAG: hypothetical protein MUP61_08110 [Burkholderiales bacterium]|nr:hypothetical protein [Burkholderiales bacterium]
MSIRKIIMILVYGALLGLQACSSVPSAALPDQAIGDCTPEANVMKNECHQSGE